MAQIDMKNTTIYIKDGYNGGGTQFLVNNGGGYSSGATTMVIDTGTVTLVTGDTFTVDTDSTLTVYTITAHAETSSVTTSITFTPGLAEAVVNNDPITILPHAIEVKIGDGNLTYSEKRNFKYVKNKGNLDTVREEDKEPVEIKMDATWEFIKADSGDPPTIEDALKKRGNASTWITSAADTCEPYAVDIIIVYDPPCSGEDDETITLSDFRYETFEHDLKAGTFSISGKCNVVEATVARS